MQWDVQCAKVLRDSEGRFVGAAPWERLHVATTREYAVELAETAVGLGFFARIREVTS